MKTLFLLTLLLFPFLQTPQSQKVETVDPAAGQFKLIVPTAHWEEIFFEEINERAHIAKLRSLRVALPKDDLELRLWNGFGRTRLEGFVLRRRGGRWSAVYLNGVYRGVPKREYQKQLAAPKSGWNKFWSKLVEMGIATLPDAIEIDCTTNVRDGMSYVVELNYEFTYRTYRYDNPKHAECEQARKMIRIGNFIAAQFRVPGMATRVESDPE